METGGVPPVHGHLLDQPPAGEATLRRHVWLGRNKTNYSRPRVGENQAARRGRAKPWSDVGDAQLDGRANG